MRCPFLCANNNLGLQALANNNHLFYLSGTQKGWGAVSGNRPSLWEPTRSGCESLKWSAELGTFVLLWILDSLQNNTPLPHYPSITFQGLWLRLTLHCGQGGTPHGETLQSVLHMEGHSGQAARLHEAVPSQWDGISWDLLEHTILRKGIPKHTVLMPQTLFLQILPFSWLEFLKFMSVYHKILTESLNAVKRLSWRKEF